MTSDATRKTSEKASKTVRDLTEITEDRALQPSKKNRHSVRKQGLDNLGRLKHLSRGSVAT